MFGFFKKKTVDQVNAGEVVANQPPDEIFPWPQGTVLTALDETTIALPMAIFGKDEPIKSVLFCPDDTQISIPKEGDTFWIRLQPGMSATLGKSCQAYVVAGDGQPRRFKLSGSHVVTKPV